MQTNIEIQKKLKNKISKEPVKIKLFREVGELP